MQRRSKPTARWDEASDAADPGWVIDYIGRDGQPQTVRPAPGSEVAKDASSGEILRMVLETMAWEW